MSAVIWCGIVAVWVFVLIPTWVRRGDLHWHRGSTGAVRAAMATPHPESMSGDAEARGRWSLMSGLRRDRSRTDEPAEVDTMDEQNAPDYDHDYDDDLTTPAHEAYAAQELQGHEGQTEQLATTSRMRVAAAPASQRLSEAVTSVSSGLKGLRGSLPGGSDRVRPPLRVRRARRLLMLAALVVATLAAAVLLGGAAIVVNIICDLALVFYVRHLRGIAREQRARALRERKARAARQAWDAASSTGRASGLDGWSVGVQESEPGTAHEEHTAPASVSEKIDLTTYEQVQYEQMQYDEYDGSEYDEAEYDARYGVAPAEAGHQGSLYDQHAPTEELTVVKAS